MLTRSLKAMCPCFIILLTARHGNVIKMYNRTFTNSNHNSNVTPKLNSDRAGSVITSGITTEVVFAPSDVLATHTTTGIEVEFANSGSDLDHEREEKVDIV